MTPLPHLSASFVLAAPAARSSSGSPGPPGVHADGTPGSAGQALDRAGRDGADEPGVVALVLIRVPVGEPGDLRGELPALPEVAVDGHRVAGAGVRAGERLAARGGELGEPRGDQVGSRDDLHVAELPHVVVPAVQRAPADEDVARAL